LLAGKNKSFTIDEIVQPFDWLDYAFLAILPDVNALIGGDSSI